ncbi:MAG: hypothetical protein BZY80_05445 [SAR202 cluster bacterium Io17-Chloro-G2]|nr:MAG: hypothetical protein BZY80_05445 [SAR202 cluster bacterium Io17-Chloro-G2]
MAESGFVKVAQTGEIAPGQMKPVRLGEEEVLLVNIDGNFHAISDTCSHQGGTLSDGDLDGEQVECPLHGAAFNVVTGDVLSPPARQGVPTHEVRISGNDILLGPARG